MTERDGGVARAGDVASSGGEARPGDAASSGGATLSGSAAPSDGGPGLTYLPWGREDVEHRADYGDVPQRFCDIAPLDIEFDGEWLHDSKLLPPVFVSRPLYGPEDLEGTKPLERERFDSYPSDFEDDPDGLLALRYGAMYYNEAMGYRTPETHELRVQAFRAAEVLYRWAASKGNDTAVANLGYIYSYDRCEGQYWEKTRRIIDGDGGAYDWECPVDEWALACYRHAAGRGDAEATYKYGDLLLRGRGCVADAAAAFASFQKAFELGELDYPSVRGSAALRLGTCFEEGLGCEPSYEESLSWYETACDYLEDAVAEGEWFYKRSLQSARDGVARMRQELGV